MEKNDVGLNKKIFNWIFFRRILFENKITKNFSRFFLQSMNILIKISGHHFFIKNGFKSRLPHKISFDKNFFPGVRGDCHQNLHYFQNIPVSFFLLEFLISSWKIFWVQFSSSDEEELTSKMPKLSWKIIFHPTY